MAVELPRLTLNVDPSIHEAKQRIRRRRILLAALLAAVAGLGVALTFALRPVDPIPATFRSSAGTWVPAGVAEVNVQAPGLFRQVTDPSLVKPIVAWFNALATQRHAIRTGIYSSACAGGYAQNVTFTFRAASGGELAKAYSAPVGADPCSPIQFSIGTRPMTWLVDPNRASSLIARVQQVLGLAFTVKVFRG